jgi:hypothetical protein
MPERKTVETAFGAVDEKALGVLQNSFDTRRLLDAVEAIDQIRSRIDGLRDDLLDLHRMAAEVINEDYETRPAREEPIWELAEMLASEMLEFADGLREAYPPVALRKGSFSPHKIVEQTCLCSNLVAPSLMLMMGNSARIHPVGLSSRSHST